jgi:hypothetical protein
MGYVIWAIGLLFGLVLFGTLFLIMHGILLRLQPDWNWNKLFYALVPIALLLFISAFTPLWNEVPKFGAWAFCITTALASASVACINYTFRQRRKGNTLVNAIFTMVGSIFLAIGVLGLIVSD